MKVIELPERVMKALLYLRSAAWPAPYVDPDGQDRVGVNDEEWFGLMNAMRTIVEYDREWDNL